MKRDLWILAGAIALIVIAAAYYRPTAAPQQDPDQPQPPARRLQLIYGRMNSCPACDQMERKTFSSPKVKAAIAERFDFEKVGTDDARLDAKSFPAYAVFRDGKRVQQGSGFMNADQFVKWLNAAQEE